MQGKLKIKAKLPAKQAAKNAAHKVKAVKEKFDAGKAKKGSKQGVVPAREVTKNIREKIAKFSNLRVEAQCKQLATSNDNRSFSIL